MSERPSDIPEDVWEAAEPVAAKVFNAYHDDDGGLGLGDPRAIVARAILAERQWWENVHRPVWSAEVDVMRAALRIAEYVLAGSHTPAEHDEALNVVRQAIARAEP